MKKSLECLLFLLLVLFASPGSVSSENGKHPVELPACRQQLLETAFMRSFNDPEEFKASGIFQLLGDNEEEVSQIGKITPRPAKIRVEAVPDTGAGEFVSLKVFCDKVFYYNLTIERVMFDFPACVIDQNHLHEGRLRFVSGRQINLITEVSADDILKVFDFYAQSRSLSGMNMKLENNLARLQGRIKKGFVTAEFALRGTTHLSDSKTVVFRCEKLLLNGMTMPRNAIATIFKQINPVFDATKTWLNLNVAKISIKPGFVETHATINHKKG